MRMTSCRTDSEVFSGVRRGAEDAPTVMVAGHMDEVGFMVTQITDNGMLRFQTLGGWWSQVLLAQRVEVQTDNGPIIGVISSIPPHILTDAQRAKPMEIKNMMIDIGADDREDAVRMGIRPGQQVVPVCPFTPMANEKKILSKAWDNRYGCGLSIELLKELQGKDLPNNLYAGATVQEEVGLRGAQTAANMIQPDLFFALDASPANDMSGDKGCSAVSARVLLRILDRTTVMHRGMREFVLDMAETHNIPYQYFASGGERMPDGSTYQTAGFRLPSSAFVQDTFIQMPLSSMSMIMPRRKKCSLSWSWRVTNRRSKRSEKMCKK